MQLLKAALRGAVCATTGAGLVAALVAGCGRATEAPAASTAAGGTGGRGGSGSKAGAAGAAGARVGPPIRWLASSPPGFEGLGIDANWEAGPSIGRDTECVVHVARDPGALMPALRWNAIAGGVEGCSPRAGLRFSDLAALGLDEAAGMRSAVLRLTISEIEGADLHRLHAAINLSTGRALELVHAWQPHPKDLPSVCGFGVARPSARMLDITFSPRSGAPKRTNGLANWDTGGISWTPFFDPNLESLESAALGPAPQVLLSVGSLGGAIGPLDHQPPLTLLTPPIPDEPQQGHSLVAYGNRGVWVEDLGDRDRIQSYTQADGVKTDHTFAIGRVRSVVFDGQRISGAIQTRFADPRDPSNQLRVWTQDPVTKEVSFSPAYVAKKLTGPAPLKAAGDWAVLGVFTGETPLKPSAPNQKAPMLSDGSVQLVLAVNLLTWQAYRIAIPPGQVIIADGFGVDDAFIYVSLRPDDINNIGIRELRRYPIARIAEWGTPWTPE